MVRGAVHYNTDDLSPVEFGFARSTRTGASPSADSLLAAVERPTRVARRCQLQADSPRVDFERESYILTQQSPFSPRALTPEYQSRLKALAMVANDDAEGVMTVWSTLGLDNSRPTPGERLARAQAIASLGSTNGDREIKELLYDRST